MSILEIVKKEWKKEFSKMTKRTGFQKVLNGTLTIDEYKAVLREIYFYVRETPQIIALVGLHLRGSQRKMIGTVLKHAASETGHEQLALDDLSALGVETSLIPFQRPLPSTSALIGFSFYQVQHENPLGYLGILFHLEFMPTTSGSLYMQCLEKIGVPREAMSFIQEHSVVDIAHNKFMERYFDSLGITDDDLDEIVYAARVAANLYGNMVDEAIMNAQSMEEKMGVAGSELTRAPEIDRDLVCKSLRKVALPNTQLGSEVGSKAIGDI